MFSFLKQTMKTVMDTVVKIVQHVHENAMNHCQSIELLKEMKNNSVISYSLPMLLVEFWSFTII